MEMMGAVTGKFMYNTGEDFILWYTYSRSNQSPAASAADSSVAGSLQDTRAGATGKPFIQSLQYKQCRREKPSGSPHLFRHQEDRPHLSDH